MKIDHDLIKQHISSIDGYAIESVQGFVWRSSQHKTMEEAERYGSYMTTEFCRTWGEAENMLYCMCRMANLMDHDSEQTDIMIRLTINGEDQEPCSLDDSTWMIPMFLIKKGYFKPLEKPLTPDTQPA